MPGHEAAGIVREVGADVTAFTSGDAVVVNPNLNCNSCERCVVGRENICQSTRLMGRETDGVLRQYLTAPHTTIQSNFHHLTSVNMRILIYSFDKAFQLLWIQIFCL